MKYYRISLFGDEDDGCVVVEFEVELLEVIKTINGITFVGGFDVFPPAWMATRGPEAILPISNPKRLKQIFDIVFRGAELDAVDHKVIVFPARLDWATINVAMQVGTFSSPEDAVAATLAVDPLAMFEWIDTPDGFKPPEAAS